jgi:hypothetical protein
MQLLCANRNACDHRMWHAVSLSGRRVRVYVSEFGSIQNSSGSCRCQLSSRGTQIHFTRASATEKRTVGSCNEAATAFAGSFGRYTRPRRRRQCRFQGRSRLSIASESRDPGLAIDIPKEEHSGGFLELIDRGKGPGKLDQRGAEEGNTR